MTHEPYPGGDKVIVLSCNNICKSYGVNTVLENISFSLQDGDRAGLVGINGAGKSTLFKILASELHADSGDVFIQKNKTLGYLSQDMGLDSSNTILQEMKTVYQDIIYMESRIRELEILISNPENMEDSAYHDSLMKEYSRLLDEFDGKNGYGYMSFIKGVLMGLGFSVDDFDKTINLLSGGEKTRVALGKLLLAKPDILLLDEPTNHLDLDAVEWLEDFLKGYKGCLFIISHDRFFLDQITNRILDLEGHKIEDYNGNYSFYVKEKEKRRENLIKQYELQQKEIERQEAIIERFRSYNREKSIRQAESREKALDRIERIERPNTEAKSARIEFKTRIRSGNDVLDVECISKSYGQRCLFSDISFHIKRGEKVALIGPNGTGKTTLFKIILGLLKQDSGHVIIGRNVNMGYYDQEQSDLDDNKTVIDEVWDTYPDLTQTRLRTILGSFLFTGEDVFKTVKLLSGGEKSRVALIKLILSESNFLLLDEPTNHLDILSKEALENALINYDGTIFTISHDRYFLNRVATRIIYFDGENGITEYPGNYSYYLEKKGRPTRFLEQPQVPQGMTRTALKEEKRKQREQEQREKQQKEALQAIENEIASLEERLTKLHELLCTEEVYSNPLRSQEVHEEIQSIEGRLEELYAEWEQFI